MAVIALRKEATDTSGLRFTFREVYCMQRAQIWNSCAKVVKTSGISVVSLPHTFLTSNDTTRSHPEHIPRPLG